MTEQKLTDNSILDYIILNNGNQLNGILDYANDRFIHFYDFSGVEDPNIILASIIWRDNEINIRFSIFCSMYFRQLSIPRVKLINRIAVEYSSVDIEKNTFKPEKTKFSVKKQ